MDNRRLTYRRVVSLDTVEDETGRETNAEPFVHHGHGLHLTGTRYFLKPSMAQSGVDQLVDENRPLWVGRASGRLEG